jgi:hypothetical protein
MTTPVVQKYLACAEFDGTTGECTEQVWVDSPGILPVLTPEEGAAFALICGLIWGAITAVGTIQESVRDN